jgi:hypothetical protein
MSEFGKPIFETQYTRGSLKTKVPTEAEKLDKDTMSGWRWAEEVGKDTQQYLDALCMPHAEGRAAILDRVGHPPPYLFKVDVELRNPVIPKERYSALDEYIDGVIRYTDKLYWVAGFSDIGYVTTKSHLCLTLWLWTPDLSEDDEIHIARFYGFPCPRYATFILRQPFYIMYKTPTPPWVFRDE